MLNPFLGIIHSVLAGAAYTNQLQLLNLFTRNFHSKQIVWNEHFLYVSFIFCMNILLSNFNFDLDSQNCVGEGNQKYFLQFLVYVCILSVYSVTLVISSWINPCTDDECKTDLPGAQARM